MFQEKATSMDKLGLRLREVDGVENIDGIEFKDCFFVDCFLNKESIFWDPFFEDSLVVCDELLKTTRSQTECLIFTSVCGVADDGGWKMCEVIRSGGVVTWNLERGNDRRSYEFEEDAYIQQINYLENQVKEAREKGKVIEPVSVFFPE